MKINKSQSNKALLDINNLFFDRKSIIKNSSYYTKLYSPKYGRINDKRFSAKTITPNNNRAIQNILNKNEKSLSLKRVFDNNKNNSRNIKIKWPKITRPKWPFTKKRTEPKELKQYRLLSSKPSHKYHDFNTIKWLCQKYSESVKEKSIYSLLPNNGKPIIPEYESEYNKRRRQIMEYLESFRKPGGREKYVNINPKYFYDNNTFKKILKLKEMFLEFDKKGNHKMIIKEIVNLFKHNNINVDINEIKQLFFKNKKNKNSKKDEPNKYLDFYQFMNFALTREQDFRQFMRKVKIKNKIEENKKQLNEINYNNQKDDKKNHTYIPINFNSIFDYFINKEKQRNSVVIVENAIKEMDKIIQGGNEKDEKIYSIESPKKEKKKKDSLKIFVPSKTLKDKNIKKLNSRNYNKTNNNNEEKNLSEKIINNYYNSSSSKNKIKDILGKNKEKYKNISFAELIKEFSSLFGIKDAKDEEIEFLEEKKRIQSAVSAKSFLFNKYNKFNIKNNKTLNKDNKDNSIDKEDKTFAETMKKEIRINSLKNLNITNFEKYHDLKLALLATKEQIKKMKKKDNELIDEDLKVYNMVDVRDIANHDNYFIKSPKNDENTKIHNIFKKPKIMNNLDKSLKDKDNNFLNIKTYCKTLKNENYSSKKKKYRVRKKKNLYNFYCGKPWIMNYVDDDDDNIINPKLTTKSKYDYVPTEFFNNRKK